jgi:uncharacterized protein (DUF2062 family)
MIKPIHWRRTEIGKYLRHLPRPKQIRGTWLHKKLGDRMFAPELWQPTRQRFAAGMAVGAFFALLPLPIQMLGAALAAYITRVNIPAAIAATWISNPLTFPICVYAQYRIGCFLIHREPIHFKSDEMAAVFTNAPWPFFVGIVPAALLLALIVYPLTLLIWDGIVLSLERSRRHRAVQAARVSAKPDATLKP